MRNRPKKCCLCTTVHNLTLKEALPKRDKFGPYYEKFYWCKKCREPIINDSIEFNRRQKDSKRNKEPKPILNCIECNTEFEKIQKAQKYCCSKCREKASRRKHKEYYKSYEKNNKDKRKERARVSRKKRVEWVKQYKQKHNCKDCGLNDWVVMEFDHIDPENKTLCISTMIKSSCSLEMIKKEIDKCEMVCANCHRRRTAKRSGWA